MTTCKISNLGKKGEGEGEMKQHEPRIIRVNMLAQLCSGTMHDRVDIKIRI